MISFFSNLYQFLLNFFVRKGKSDMMACLLKNRWCVLDALLLVVSMLPFLFRCFMKPTSPLKSAAGTRLLFLGQQKLWCFKVLWAIFHATLASLSRPWILQKSVGWDLRSVADTIGVFLKRFFQLWNPWFWEILKKLGRYIKLNRTCKMVVYVCLCFFCNILNGANN